MPSANKVILIGNATRDPELRFTPSNTAVCQFGLAINRKFKGRDGEAQEETTFVDLEAWQRSAEIISQYVRKGAPLYVEGRLKLDSWSDRDGNQRQKLKVVVEQFQLLGGNRSDSDSRGSRQSAPVDGPHEPIDESSIPF